MVATSSSSGFEWTRLQRASWYSFLRSRIICRTLFFSGVASKSHLIGMRNADFGLMTDEKPAVFILILPPASEAQRARMRGALPLIRNPKSAAPQFLVPA